MLTPQTLPDSWTIGKKKKSGKGRKIKVFTLNLASCTDLLQKKTPSNLLPASKLYFLSTHEAPSKLTLTPNSPRGHIYPLPTHRHTALLFPFPSLLQPAPFYAFSKTIPHCYCETEKYTVNIKIHNSPNPFLSFSLSSSQSQIQL